MEDTPPKKPKRATNFNKNWLDTNKWLKRISDGKAFCVLCKIEFSVANKGFRAVVDHESSAQHRKNETAASVSKAITTYFTKPNTQDADLVIASEITHIYHCIKHNQSYNSMDCILKLTKQTHSDSAIGKKISCGRTKAEAIVRGLLAPKIIDDVLQRVKRNDVYFSVQIDASNHKNRKFIPLVVQYFSLEKGIQNKLVDFYEVTEETADSLFLYLKKSLQSLGLSFENVTSLSADNTNYNFGCKNSIYTRMNSENPRIIKANCYAHIMHNCLKHCIEQLSVDIENILNKFFHYFAKSAKRRECLKNVHDFFNMEFKELLKYCPTRWLSLLPAVERTLLSWPALKEYFEELSRNNELSAVYTRALYISDHKIDDSIEIYFLFIHHFSSLFQNTVKIIEASNTTIVDLFNILTQFLNELESRKTHGFYGNEVRIKLSNIQSEVVKGRMLKEFDSFIKTGISYLKTNIEKNTGLEFLKQVNSFSLKTSFPSFEQFVAVTDSLKLKVNLNNLFNEFIAAETIFNNIKDFPKFQLAHCSEKWRNILNSGDFPNLFNFVSFFLSVPSSSAYVERIFSVMNNKWRDERNKCLPELIKAELIIYFNYEFSCLEFFNHIKNERTLLKEAKKSNKYSFYN